MNTRHIVTYHYRVVTLDASLPSILSLENYRQLVHHFRDLRLQPPTLERMGGATVSVVKNDRKGTYHIGISVCNKNDMYDKKYGTKISLDRARKAAEKGQKFGTISRNIKEESGIDEVLDVITVDIPLRYIFDNDSLSNSPATNIINLSSIIM